MFVARIGTKWNSLVSYIGCCKNSVASNIWALQKPQHHIARRLQFVTDVLMPQRARSFLLEKSRNLLFVAITVDDVKAWVSSDSARDWLVVKFAKILHELGLNTGTVIDDVLVRESNYFSL
jgi:hypothetical protein